VASYFAYWSQTSTDVEGLAQYYGDSATFYGSEEPREKIMDEKRKFSVRWPLRRYNIKQNTLYAECTDTCSVTGVVEWDVSSPQRATHSVGTANFVFKIALNGTATGGTIISENGAVLAAHNDTLPAPQAALSANPADASNSAGFAAGRQARLEYEAWFNPSYSVAWQGFAGGCRVRR
jgi:hypothetical protein